MHFIIGQFWQVVGGMLAGLFIGFLLVLAYANSKTPTDKAPVVTSALSPKPLPNANTPRPFVL